MYLSHFTLTYFDVVNLETKKTIIVANPEEFILRISSSIPFHQDKISG